jgi:membrane associated rhomboid family serine protease
LFASDIFIERWGIATLFPAFQAQFFGLSFIVPREIVPWLVSFVGSLIAHANVWHWLSNATLMLIVGAYLQEHMRTRDIWATYLLCGLGAHVAFFVERPLGACLGASGALFGLAGIGAARAHPLLLVLFSARVALEIGLVGTASNIAHSAHVGGALTGLILLAAGLVKSDRSASRR